MDVTTIIKCPQCGGKNSIPVDEKFFECQFCGSAVYVDKSKVVSHFVIVCNFKKEEAEGNLRRWMAGNFHVKDLDRDAQITQSSFYYFPMWYFKMKDVSGEKIYLQPATSTAISEIKKIVIPAGNMKVFNKEEFNEKDFITPDVLYNSASSWLKESGVNTEQLQESDLVHIPFYQFYYNYKGAQYSAIVEASSGMVYANLWPAKSEAPFRAVFGLAIFAFFAASLISYFIGYTLSSNGGMEGMYMGEPIKIVLYLIASVPLILIAYFIAKKV
ncbi:hypothetical protein BH10BAC5_BH10BAC5_08960 [soil metagenome]